MPYVFQYQALAEPLFTTPEVPAMSSWYRQTGIPVWQPPRAQQAHTLFWPVVPPVPDMAGWYRPVVLVTPPPRRPVEVGHRQVAPFTAAVTVPSLSTWQPMTNIPQMKAKSVVRYLVYGDNTPAAVTIIPTTSSPGDDIVYRRMFADDAVYRRAPTTESDTP